MTMVEVTAAGWLRAQEALREEVGRVVKLLRSLERTDLPAVGHWNIGDVAMHLSQAWVVVPALARADPSAISAIVPAAGEMPSESPLEDIWDRQHATSAGVRSDPERDLAVLADRIESRAEEYLASCAGAPAHEMRARTTSSTRRWRLLLRTRRRARSIPQIRTTFVTFLSQSVATGRRSLPSDRFESELGLQGCSSGAI